MVRGAGLADPLRSPDQPEKLYSEPAVAEMETLCPPLCQFVPEGLTVPPPEGLTAVVKLYWVVKLAVYVVLVEGAVIVRS
jgi:hypothetical protein